MRFRVFKYLPNWRKTPADEVVDLNQQTDSYINLASTVRRTWETHLEVTRTGRLA